MNNREQIEQEIEKTLECFDTAEHLEADPHFFTRLQARIKTEQQGNRSLRTKLFSFGMLRPALLGTVIVLNILTAVMIFGGPRRQEDTRDRYLEILAEEYSLGLEGESSSILE